ncbi:MAG TPA: FtsX-like permease family protein [Chitinophagaceae bacterium]|nr:FtsX-like permease family protein [Chitinophagaceae bacterium]
MGKSSADNWGDNSFQMFVELNDNADIKNVSAKIRDIKLKNVNADDAKYKPAIILHPMNKWHLYSEFKNGVNTGGAIEYVWLFGIIGAFVLLLACINFMNLSTARSEKRAKEVGIRKAVGSLRAQLISQFFCESLLTAVLACFLSIALVSLVLPYFNTIAAKPMILPWGNIFFWLACIVFTLFTGIIAGIYPALYLSSFKPVKVLKGTFKAGRFSAMPRKVLVVVQFAVSVILIAGTIVVFKQIQYAKNRPVGYSREGLINIQVSTLDLHNHFAAVRQELLSAGVITDMTESSSPMTGLENNRGDLDWKEKDPNTTYDFANIRVSSSYGKTAGWQVLAGRDFNAALKADSEAVILNEAAVKYMGLKQPLGEIVTFAGRAHTVIGVTKDMVMSSPYEPARQTIFYLSRDGFDDILIRINPLVSTHEAIGKIEAVCKKYSPAVPFSYAFTDNKYSLKFNSEERIGNLAAIFASLAIFISCLGLSGMASFMAEQRTKEIGVRKVLGASSFNLWRLMSSQFILLVTVALLIAIPVSYTAMNKWLLNYEYRTNISWWIFVFTAAGALLITLLAVSYQSIKAATMNPVKSLRTE